MNKLDRRPKFTKTPIIVHNFSETMKDTTKGKVIFFKVDGKTVAYIANNQGWRSKDEVDKETVNKVSNFFARHRVDYMGKIPQADIERL